MNRKFIGILIIVSGLLIMVGLVYFVFLKNMNFDKYFGKTKKQEPVPARIIKPKPQISIDENREEKEDPAPTKIISHVDSQTGGAVQQENISQEVSVDDLKRIAAVFAERFGSYSNQSNFSNVTDMELLMSETMKTQSRKYIFDQRQKEIGDKAYYAIATRAISEEVPDFDEKQGRAKVLVKTRRKEMSDSGKIAEKVFEQMIEIYFVKENNSWKVDKISWLEN